MAIIENYANLPSVADYNEIKEKFPAYTVAVCSEKARKDELLDTDSLDNIGTYFTRSASPESPKGVMSVSYGGNLDYFLSIRRSAGLRVALQTTYNPESSLVKSCKEVSRKSGLLNTETRMLTETTSTAPIVLFGKKPYIWLNKDECEHGTEKTMRLVSEELLARAVSFDKKCETNNYGSEAAAEIRSQCEEEALEFATEEEKSMLVKVRLSDKDGYEKAEPILETKHEKMDVEKPLGK